MGHNSGALTPSQYQVAIQPNLGLDANNRQAIIEILNTTLCDEGVLAAKTRCLYWNIKGPSFFQLHPLFAAQYQQLNDLSNEIAERARVLGGAAFGSLRSFLEHTRLGEQPEETLEVIHLLADHEIVIRFLREDAKRCADELEDEGTVALLINAIRIHEKMAWVLRSFVESE